jgi:hypothetical protein
MQNDLRFRICPPFFSLRGMRVDSPTSNIKPHYEHDAKFFKSNLHRRVILRPAFLNEFDICSRLSIAVSRSLARYRQTVKLR